MLEARLRTHRPYEIASCRMCQTWMWIITSDDSLCVFDTKNESVTFVEILIPESLTAGPVRLVVCPDNRKCVIVTHGGHVFLCHPATKALQRLPDMADGIPSCGSWRMDANGTYKCTFGMHNGLVVEIGENGECTWLYRMKSRVRDVVHVSGEINMLVMMTDSELGIAAGHGPIDEILAESSNIVRLGVTPTTNKGQRIYVEKVEDLCRICVLRKNDIAEFTLCKVGRYPRQAVYPVAGCNAFLSTEYGIFAARRSGVCFMSRFKYDKWKFVVDLADVQRMFLNDGCVWFVTKNAFYYMWMSTFLERVVKEAERAQDHEFVLIASNDRNAQRMALVGIVKDMDAQSAADKLATMKWPFQDIVVCFLSNGPVLIAFLKVVLGRAGGLRRMIASLCFSLYVRELRTPAMREGLLSFIDTHGRLLDRKHVLPMLYGVGFDEALERYEKATQQYDALVVRYLSRGDIERAVKLLPMVENAVVVNEVLLSVVKSGKQDIVCNYVRGYKEVERVRLIPVLCAMPELAAPMIQRDTFDGSMVALVAFCLSVTRDEAGLVKTVLGGTMMSGPALRFARQFGLTSAVARLLIECGKIEEAVETAKLVSTSYAKELLHGCGMKLEMRRRGWKRLLALLEGEERREVFEFVLELELFDFADVIDMTTDDDNMLVYRNFIDAYVAQARQDADLEQFNVPMKREPTGALVFNVRDVCELCDKALAGGKFIHFPCQHRCHLDCVKEKISDLEWRKVVNREREGAFSCPLCGFLAVIDVADMHE